ncbi:hypothetical protein Osc7112_2690 [Oscillatoria nigro-viridis PCC 7112]|uniref:Uncharacterized protein n=1 Tax=Phormidium nigroviride PCC 7112 TaxID=179408 RepID=K9VHW4_9CYAN|nr:hypothetical protein [Oscillatoria nigro-viridis]AFZ07104.1 hypothetical protein Osc7112_2690 [Oscillatoria nigro-viridis PCC 7112]
MTRHDTPVEPLAALVPVGASFNLLLPPTGCELKPISLTLLLLAGYSAIFPGRIELSRCHPNVPVNTDEQLRQLLQLLKDSQEGSKEQERLKNQLCQLIPRLPGIRKHPYPNIDLEEMMQEAYCGFLKTLSAFLRGIDLDNLAADVLRTRVVQRFNKTLKNKVYEQYRRMQQQIFSVSFDAPITSNRGEKFAAQEPIDHTTKNGIEQLIEREQAQNKQRIGRQLWQCIEDDPTGELRNSYPNEKIDKKKPNNPENRRPRPDANSHVLALRLLLQDPPDKLSKIARELNIDYQTLNSHWKRTGLALVKEIALKFGYQPEE